MIYAGGGFSINRLYSLVTPPHHAACGVLGKVILMIYRYRDMIYSASQNMIYAGGEFSFIRFRGSVTPPRQVACAP